MPGQKISKADREKVDPKFICTVCALLLSAPMQTPCGHLLCFVCLQSLLSNTAVCPADGTPLRKEQVFPDAFTRRELLELRLHCPNSDDGCDWFGTNRDLQEHIPSCGHALVPCVHENCKKEVKRSLLAEHLKRQCDYRRVKCKFCKEELPFASLKQHVDTVCSAVSLTCQYCGNTEIPRQEIKTHEKENCPEIPAQCEFKVIGCPYDKVPKRKDLQQHLIDGITLHIKLLLTFVLDLCGKVKQLFSRVDNLDRKQAGQYESLKQHTESLQNEVDSIGRNLMELKEKHDSSQGSTEGNMDISILSAELRKMKTRLVEISSNYEKVMQRNRTLENELNEKTALMNRMRTRLDHMDESLALTTVKVTDLTESNQGFGLPSYNGTLLWRIDGFKQKRKEAIDGTKLAIYSPPFYSSQFGYKMCARIYMNGDGFGKGTHISLFFVVMMGEYDALIPWPFQKKITMMLMDQVTGDHMIDAFRSDPESSSFQRPKTKMNIASGSPLFMPLDSLHNRAYVRDDTMFIKIIID